MNFNKKLLTLVIAHFAFAQFVFAMDGAEEEKEVSDKAKGRYTVSVSVPVSRAALSDDLNAAYEKAKVFAASKGVHEKATFAKELSVAVLRWGAVKGFDLYTAIDSRTGLCTRAKDTAVRLDTAITERGQAKQICGFALYQWAKGKATMVVATASDLLFPKDHAE